jgi:hypothetical protein
MHNVHVQFFCTYTLILLLVVSSLPAGGLKEGLELILQRY